MDSYGTPSTRRRTPHHERINTLFGVGALVRSFDLPVSMDEWIHGHPNSADADSFVVQMVWCVGVGGARARPGWFGLDPSRSDGLVSPRPIAIPSRSCEIQRNATQRNHAIALHRPQTSKSNTPTIAVTDRYKYIYDRNESINRYIDTHTHLDLWHVGFAAP